MSKRKVQTEKRKNYDDELGERQADRESMQRLCEHSWAQASEPISLPFSVTRVSSGQLDVYP